MANVKHFAIHADDVERARAFYSSAFDWRFEDWGPPEFYNVRTGSEADPGLMGALERRHEQGGKPIHAFVCTIGVDDIDEAAKRVEAAGGTILYPKTEIPTVGWLFHFLDTEGNVVAAMQYDEGHS